jgi:hypothetical protein
LLDSLVHQRKEEGRDFQVVAYMFEVRGWEAHMIDETTKGNVPIYLYRFKAAAAENEKDS